MARAAAYAALLLSVTALALPTLTPAGAAADPTRRTARRASQPTPTNHAAPDVTGTIKTDKPSTSPTPPASPTEAARDDDETIPKPFDLPTAPRSRMRACGESWQAMKMSGQAGDQTWRDFATRCLADASSTPGPSR